MCTRVCLYGVDIDSLRKGAYIYEWRKLVHMVDFVETRNAVCARQLKEVTDDKNKIVPGVDLTHAFFTREEKTQIKDTLYKKYSLTEGYMIWAVAMPWSKEELENAGIKARYMRLCGQLQQLIRRYSACRHIFLPFFEGTDIVMIHDLLAGMQIDFKVIPSNCPLGEKRLLFQYAKRAVVMRFHGVQFALFHGTPFLAISYSPKTTNILNELGLRDLYVEFGIRSDSCFMREFDIADDEWKSWEDNMDTRTDDIKRASNKLKETAFERKKQLLNWLGEKDNRR